MARPERRQFFVVVGQKEVPRTRRLGPYADQKTAEEVAARALDLLEDQGATAFVESKCPIGCLGMCCGGE